MSGEEYDLRFLLFNCCGSLFARDASTGHDEFLKVDFQ